MARKKLGETLVSMGVIDQDTLNQALALQAKSKRRLGQVLEDMNVLLEEDIARALAKQYGFRYAKGLKRFRFPDNVLDLLDPETIISKLIFPLKIEGKSLLLAMVDPLDIEMQENLAFKIGLNITPCVTTPEEIKAALQKNYMVDVSAKEAEDRHWSVLLVDDQNIVLSAAEAALKKEGYTIYKAENGAEGLKLALQLRPHVIVTDMLMPRMDGKEFFRVLQSNHNISHIPVIALSSKGTPENEYEILDMGFFDFVPKPINPLRLAARVKRAMRTIYEANK